MDTKDVVLGLGDDWRFVRGPLYQRLAAAFRDSVRRGDLGPRTRLPSERDLARLLGVSRTTVASAYAALRQAGLVESVRGSGTRISLKGADGLVPGVVTPSLRFLGDASGAGDVVDCASASVAEIDEVPEEVLAVTGEEVRSIVAGFVYEPLGMPRLRQAVADRYTSHGVPTTTDEVLITTGAQQAVFLLFTLFGRDRGTLLVENPTYVGALDAIRLVGASAVGVSTTEDGIDLPALEDKLRRFPASVVYVMTTCQNPTGAVMSENERAGVGELADRAQTPIIDDMTLSDLVFAEPRPAMLAASTRGTVITIGSLSKLYWPGLRVGWVRGPAALISRLAKLKVVTDLGSSHYSQLLAARLVEAADTFASSRRVLLRERFQLLADLLRNELPTWRATTPRGGPFLWVSLPHGQADSFASLALRHGVQVLPGTRMSLDDSKADHLRISYVALPEHLREAVKRLRAAWEVFDAGAGETSRLDVVV